MREYGYYQQLLKEKYAELAAVVDAGAVQAQVVELDQTKVGRLSRMDALQAQAMSKETNRRRQLEMQRIKQALNRIKQEEYGYCLECGELIAEQRLAINPATPVCIDCAE